MIPDLLVPVLLAALAGLALTAVLWLAVDRRRVRRELARACSEAAAARAEAEETRQRLDQLARAWERSSATQPAQEFVITHLGEDPGAHELAGDADPAFAAEGAELRIDGKLFADIVLRESVVKAASFAYGVRRALAPENRNRIRFEMRREVKRSRKQRRADFRAWRRETARLRAQEDAA